MCKDFIWWDLVVFGVLVVIGVGIFMVIVLIVGDIIGLVIWILFLIVVVICVLVVLCYVEFVLMLLVVGSVYIFFYVIFGEFLVWVIGWNLVLELVMGVVVVVKGWFSYLGIVFGFGNGIGYFGLL